MIASPEIKRIYLPLFVLSQTLEHLRHYGAKGLECTLAWSGKLLDRNEAIVTTVIRPEQHATALRARVDPSEVAKIYLELYERKEFLLAQIHSHPGAVFHSVIDDSYPIVYKAGFISIVVPGYGFVKPEDFFRVCAVYEYQEDGFVDKLRLSEIMARFKIFPKDFEQRLFSRTRLFVEQLDLPSNEVFLTLRKSKVAVFISDELLHTCRGQHMLVASVNLLARCCVDIDVFLPNHDVAFLPAIPLVGRELVDSLAKLCLRINPNCIFRVNPELQKYHSALIIGENGSTKAEQCVFIDGCGWLSYVGTKRGKCFSGDSENPIGPLIGACYGSAEVFKALLNKIAKARFKPIESLTFSALDYKINQTSPDNPSLPGEISLTACLIGAGAIGMAVAYALASLPAVSGNLAIIDPEDVEISNLNRYTLATIGDVGLPKANVVEQRLQDRFEIDVFKGTYHQYPRRGKHPMAVVTVDNVKTRCEVQLDFPEIILNAGMYGNSFTVSRHDDFLNKACLGCLYPIYSEVSPKQQYPATPFTSLLAGTLLAGEALKERAIELRPYRLDNAFIINDLFGIPKIGEMYLLGRLFEKSDNCGCNCASAEVIELYSKSQKR